MPARLHQERVSAPGATPRRWLLITHGIYGAGGNWRSIARRVVEKRHDWGCVLVDLRQHGRSDPGEPPHDLAACAADLAVVVEEAGASGAPIGAVAGHSFGGKVVLALRGLPAAAAVAQTWMLDSTPSARADAWDAIDNSVRQVWESLKQMSPTWHRREGFVAAMTDRGFELSLAQWLAMNLEPVDGGGFVVRLDLDAIRPMLDDYYRRDLWSLVEDPALPGEVHMVVAARSNTVSVEDRARLAEEPPARRVITHLVAGADHWLHIDAPQSMVALFVDHLPAA